MEHKDFQVFNFQGKQVRVVMKGAEPWWIGKDVCDILGYANSRKAIEDHCKHKETFGVTIRDTGKGSVQQMAIIPESDVYRLIMRSNLPEAERFEVWVMEEVLPSIRKHGTYMTPQKIEETALNPDMLTTLIHALREEQEVLRAERDKVAELETQIEDQQSLVSFAESLQNELDSQKSILIGGFRKIVREGNMLFIWVEPSTSVKGIAPSSATLKEEGGEPFRLRLTYGAEE